MTELLADLTTGCWAGFPEATQDRERVRADTKTGGMGFPDID